MLIIIVKLLRTFTVQFKTKERACYWRDYVFIRTTLVPTLPIQQLNSPTNLNRITSHIPLQPRPSTNWLSSLPVLKSYLGGKISGPTRSWKNRPYGTCTLQRESSMTKICKKKSTSIQNYINRNGGSIGKNSRKFRQINMFFIVKRNNWRPYFMDNPLKSDE